MLNLRKGSLSKTQVQVSDQEERKGRCAPAFPDPTLTPTLPGGGFVFRLTGHQS